MCVIFSSRFVLFCKAGVPGNNNDAGSRSVWYQMWPHSYESERHEPHLSREQHWKWWQHHVSSLLLTHHTKVQRICPCVCVPVGLQPEWLSVTGLEDKWPLSTASHLRWPNSYIMIQSSRTQRTLVEGPQYSLCMDSKSKKTNTAIWSFGTNKIEIWELVLNNVTLNLQREKQQN